MTETAQNHDAQFVTLGIDREVFAVPVDAVLEILDMRSMFRIPEAGLHDSLCNLVVTP